MASLDNDLENKVGVELGMKWNWLDFLDRLDL